mmetsp:Transcript_21449/g.63302  ORF Transcript_21449/g.63302 Transcript_21449/m.63302 type:complete len:96 (-) Transcript_21449:2072-2359(-)
MARAPSEPCRLGGGGARKGCASPSSSPSSMARKQQKARPQAAMQLRSAAEQPADGVCARARAAAARPRSLLGHARGAPVAAGARRACLSPGHGGG